MQEPTDYYLYRQIGNYRLVKQLGGGAFGSVYQAQHIIFGDDVAIKILHANLRSQQERERFFHEARILNTLQHPNILHILDAGLHEGVCYIVMDYASGGSLNDRLKQHPGQALPQNEALAIIEQVGSTLKEGNKHWEAERYDEALQAYDHALRLGPNYAIAHNNKGNALYGLKRYDEAVQALDHALRLDPNLADVYYNKGVVLEELGREKEAQQMFEKARQLGYTG